MSSSHLMKLIAIAFLLSMAIVGCSPKPSEQEQEVVGCTSEETPALVDDQDPYEPTIVHEETPSDRGPLCYAPAPGGKKGDNSTVNKNKYEVRLGASQLIDKDSDGQMTVRIGLPETLQEKDSTEVYNSLFVAPADVRKYARITPRASDFIVDPDTPQIIKVSSTSSTAASFSLKPKKIGVFKVSAKVEFSPTKDFSEIDGTQWTNTLSVTVEVNSVDRKKNRIEEIASRRGENIERIYITPNSARPSPGLLEAIADAEAIVIAPGSLYTNVIPNLLVKGVAKAIKDSKAIKVYV